MSWNVPVDSGQATSPVVRDATEFMHAAAQVAGRIRGCFGGVWAGILLKPHLDSERCILNCLC